MPKHKGNYVGTLSLLTTALGIAIATSLFLPGQRAIAQGIDTQNMDTQNGNTQDENTQGENVNVVRPLDYLGLCDMGQRDLSGRWIDDGTGEMVPLMDACEVARQVHEAPELAPEETQFWSAFSAAANEAALSFAASFEPDAVANYGKAVCSSLIGGESMSNIRTIQQQGNLPAAFDAAVNVAAIHAYCPSYAAEIGR
ncbi:MAG: DUF732 domain-containing protein [Cyanothece sp. SIO2G6]|nr:DUF732 domain-containing protein [Cyanothece sp. SIO2G6]